MAAFIPIFMANNARRIAAANAQAQADAYHKLEEGEYASSEPEVRGVSEATWRFVGIATMSCSTIMGIMMLVEMFVSRFVYQDPTLQDPYKMMACAVIALGVMGTGYIPTIAHRQEMQSREAVLSQTRG